LPTSLDIFKEILEEDLLRLEEWLEKQTSVPEKGFEKGQESEEMSVLIQNHVAIREKIADDEAALKRIEEGTYEICSTCGGKITEERHMVVPSAKHCTACQQKKTEEKNLIVFKPFKGNRAIKGRSVRR
jgi:RNA polymerase-binding transcription factor DksA